MTPVLMRTSARRIIASLPLYISFTRPRFQSRRDTAGSPIKTNGKRIRTLAPFGTSCQCEQIFLDPAIPKMVA